MVKLLTPKVSLILLQQSSQVSVYFSKNTLSSNVSLSLSLISEEVVFLSNSRVNEEIAAVGQ